MLDWFSTLGTNRTTTTTELAVTESGSISAMLPNVTESTIVTLPTTTSVSTTLVYVQDSDSGVPFIKLDIVKQEEEAPLEILDNMRTVPNSTSVTVYPDINVTTTSAPIVSGLLFYH